MTEPLTDEQLRSFRLNGFLHLPGLIPHAELAASQQDTAEMIQKALNEQNDSPNYNYGIDALDASKTCLYRINNLITDYGLDSIKHLLAYPPLLQAISQVVCGDHFVSSNHSTVFKVPYRGYPVPWHQDPVSVKRFPVFEVDIYLDEATTENGCLYVIPGSHLAGYHAGPDIVRSWTMGLEETAPGAIAIETKPGDVVFHSTAVLHGSFWNRSDSLRRTIYFHIDHLEDMRLQATDYWLRPLYLTSQEVVADAIDVRKRAYADETPFPYRAVSAADLLPR